MKKCQECSKARNIIKSLLSHAAPGGFAEDVRTRSLPLSYYAVARARRFLGMPPLAEGSEGKAA